MKTILLFALIVLSTVVNAQYSNTHKSHGKKEICMYIPAVVLTSTFGVNEALGGNVSYACRSTIAITGMILAVVSYYIVKYIKKGDIIKKIKSKRRRNHKK